MSSPSDLPDPFDPSVPNVARIYDFLLGGKDHYHSDREAAERILDIEPGAAVAARENRGFLRRVVEFLAGEAGVRQFLDIGSGLPAAGNVHQVAQAAAPESRVVYVDSDPVVLANARALLVSGPRGACDYVGSDLRDTGTVVAGAARTLDFTRPVAVLLLSIMHFIPDRDDPWGIARRLMDAVPPGSYLAVSHAAAEHISAAAIDEMDAVYAGTASGGVTPRPLPDIVKFLSGLELVDPGVTDITAWRPDAGETGGGSRPVLFYGCVGRKPGA